MLEAARSAGIEIPTLCYYESVIPSGTCRLCIVEIIADRTSRVVSSCVYPAQEGLVVDTRSDRVVRERKLLIELLLARCPQAKVIQDLAQEYGIEKTRLKVEKADELCVVCGLCVQVCDELVGVNAIGFANRGARREVTTAFHEPSAVCIGCGSCAYICPTEAIKMEDKGNIRIIHNWNTTFELQQCKICGNYFATKAHLNYLKQRLNLSEGFFEICPDCIK